MTPEFIAWQTQPANEARAKAKEASLAAEAERLGVSAVALHDRWVEEWRQR